MENKFIQYPVLKECDFVKLYAEQDEFIARIKKSLAFLTIDSLLEGQEFVGFKVGSTSKDDFYSQCNCTYAFLLLLNGQESQRNQKQKGKKSKTKALLTEKEHNYVIYNISWIIEQIKKGKEDRYVLRDLGGIETETPIRVVSLIFSLMIQIQVAKRNNALDFSNPIFAKDPRIANIDREISEVMKACLRYLTNAFILKRKNEKCRFSGWNLSGPIKEVSFQQSSLFFTYTVSSLFLDFEDLILSKQDEELFKSLKQETVKNPLVYGDVSEQIPLVDLFEEQNRISGLEIWDYYKDILRDTFFTENKKIVDSEDVISQQSSAPYNAMFICLTILNTSVNRILRNDIKMRNLNDMFVEINRDNKEQDDFSTAIKYVTERLHKLYQEAVAQRKSYTIIKYQITTDDDITANSDLLKAIEEVNNRRLIGAQLVPLLVQASNLVAFYINKFPQKEISLYFDLVLKNCMSKKDYQDFLLNVEGEKRGEMNAKIDAFKDEELWLWDENGFNIDSTVSYIKAVLFFYDYYSRYEKEIATNFEKLNYIREEVNNEWENKFQEELNKTVSEKLEQLKEDQYHQIRKELVSEFKIESAIISKIEEVSARKAEQRVNELLKEIIQRNMNSWNRKGKKRTAEERQEDAFAFRNDYSDSIDELNDLVQKTIMSYLGTICLEDTKSEEAIGVEARKRKNKENVLKFSDEMVRLLQDLAEFLFEDSGESKENRSQAMKKYIEYLVGKDENIVKTYIENIVKKEMSKGESK